VDQLRNRDLKLDQRHQREKPEKKSRLTSSTGKAAEHEIRGIHWMDASASANGGNVTLQGSQRDGLKRGRWLDGIDVVQRCTVTVRHHAKFAR
jgi:hypothetical protein